MIIDSQVHAYERNHPDRPWIGTIPGPASANADEMIAAMDAAGVDGALLVSPWSLYRDDPSYAVEAYEAYPTRFRLIAPIDSKGPDVAGVVDRWASTPGAVGIRLMIWGDDVFDASDRGVRDAVAGADRHDFPVCVHCWGRLDLLDELAIAYPSTRFVLDHLGLPQPMQPPAPPDAFDDLPKVLELARHSNVYVKVSGACTMSRRPFPFDDLWEPVGRLVSTFGAERSMWGTDWTRAVALVTYPEALAAFRDHFPLSEADRVALLGGTAATVFGWNADRAQSGLG